MKELTDEQDRAITWAESAVRGKRLGASTTHLARLLEVLNELFVESELSHRETKDGHGVNNDPVQ